MVLKRMFSAKIPTELCRTRKHFVPLLSDFDLWCLVLVLVMLSIILERLTLNTSTCLNGVDF